MNKSSRRLICSHCGQRAHIERSDFPFIEQTGLRVYLYDIEVIVCKACGNRDPIIPRVNDLMRTVAAAIVAKPYRMTGAEARFLRKHLEMTGEVFARLLHVDKTTVSKWENDEDPVGEQSDLLVRSLVLLRDERVREKLKSQPDETFPQVRPSKRTMPINIDSKTAAFGYADAAGLLSAAA